MFLQFGRLEMILEGVCKGQGAVSFPVEGSIPPIVKVNSFWFYFGHALVVGAQLPAI